MVEVVMACEEEETSWVAFEDDEEALSLSDLPVVDRGEAGGDSCCGVNRPGEEEGDAAAGITAAKCPEAADEFEFRTCSGGLQLESAAAEMCAADEVFFQGQILPLRPSVSSEGGLFPASRCGSRSDSMDRYSSATGSLGFESSRSLSGRSSGSISRSQSTHSSNSASSCAAEAPARLSISNIFYAHPSPKPHVCSSRRKSTSCSARKSTSSAGSGWGLLRLGLVKTPEIDLDSLRRRKSGAAAAAHNSASSNRTVANGVDGGRPAEKKAPTQLGTTARCNSSSNARFDAPGDGSRPHKEEKPAEKKASWSLGGRLRCHCSPGDVVETTCSRIVVAGGPAERERARLAPSPSLKRRQEGTCHSRTFQWLAELPVPKPPEA